jgi:hypothetical protein
VTTPSNFMRSPPRSFPLVFHLDSPGFTLITKDETAIPSETYALNQKGSVVVRLHRNSRNIPAP